VEYPVTILLNETPDMNGMPHVLLRPFTGRPARLPGDRYVLGWSGTVEAPDMESAARQTAVAHTLDDRPSGQVHRSVLMGDIVAVAECCFLVTFDGVEPTGPPDEVDRSPWTEVVAERYASHGS
jgi:hypothetical protein